ncbi:MAG: uroporphyrinogen decarboxylase [Acidimicrobium sp.]|nr:MAG: uroporphyrinogen decarboxylase [Acidimicrobium sp.]
MTSLPNDPFLAAARGQQAIHTPVWFMRQAGRSLPEYKALRGEGSILDAIKKPELAAEFTLQPVRRHNVDAAVLYSDIVVPAHAVGFGIDVAPGTGPVAASPFRSSNDLARLRPLHHEDIEYVTDTVLALVKELKVPLLAFAGAPFTVASYLIEGRPSRTYQNTKRLMREDEVLWHEIMEHLSQHSVEFISAQISAGAEAFQLFDSWAGALSRSDYDTYVKPHSTSVFSQLAERHPGVAGIHYGIGCDHLLESMNSVGNAIIGLDWRTTIRNARTRLGADTVVQGNLDPALVLAGSSIALAGAETVLADNAGHPGHIFNLGHGVQPDTDPSVLTDIVAYVHEKTKK